MMPLAEQTLAWTDQWFDPEVSLLRNPPGSFLSQGVADGAVHLLPQSAWYAFGLFERSDPGDTDRANAVLAAVLAHQYDRPGTVWHGTFSRFAETPEPDQAQGRAREWTDYDPNWRQFIGTTLLLLLRHHEGAVADVTAVERALRLAAVGEPADRVTAAYTNIALMKALVLVEAGGRLGEPGWVHDGHELAAAVVTRFHDHHDAFDEFNSPTYYGIDLFGLALWRTCPVSEVLRRDGAALEAALWADVARFWHAGLRNLAGPMSRTYGADMGRYVAAVSLWIAEGVGIEHAPLPPFTPPDVAATPIDHGHDLVLAPLVARLGAVIPDHVVEMLRRTEGPAVGERFERLIGRRGGSHERVAAAWFGPGVAVGAERQSAGWHAVHQYRPVLVQWSVPTPPSSFPVPSGPTTSPPHPPALPPIVAAPASVGGLWLTVPLPTSAEVDASGVLSVSLAPPLSRSATDTTEPANPPAWPDAYLVIDIANGEPTVVDDHLHLPGLTVTIGPAAAVGLAAPVPLAPLWLVPLVFRGPTETPHTLVLRPVVAGS